MGESRRGTIGLLSAHRQLTRENVNRAHSIIILSILWIILAVFVIVILEPKATLTQAVFRGCFCLGDGGADFEFDAPFMCGK